MKRFTMALILLIGMISFMGFSSNTIDPCQDSNHEFVMKAENAEINFHGVLVFDELKILSSFSYEEISIFNSIVNPKILKGLVFEGSILDIKKLPDIKTICKINYKDSKPFQYKTNDYRRARDGLNQA